MVWGARFGGAEGKEGVEGGVKGVSEVGEEAVAEEGVLPHQLEFSFWLFRG